MKYTVKPRLLALLYCNQLDTDALPSSLGSWLLLTTFSIVEGRTLALSLFLTICPLPPIWHFRNKQFIDVALPCATLIRPLRIESPR